MVLEAIRLTLESRIQGKSVSVVVGQNSLHCTYALPVALLCVHSLYFCNKIAALNAMYGEKWATSKKRKIPPSNDGEEAEAKDEVEVEEGRKDGERVIRLPDVDPAIFGLFLKFIYKDSYPSNVDARAITAQNHHRSLTVVPKPTISGSTTTAASRQPASNPPPASSNQHIQATPPPSYIPTLMPPPLPPQGMNHIECMPPSLHAWLLAQRLGALSFMNYAISRIYAGIGVYFALTPALMDQVWRETSPSSSPLPSPSPPSSTFSSPSTPSTSTVLTPSPLRKLLLDVLVSYWSHTHSPNPNAVILRSLSVSPNFSTSLKEAWDRLFNEYTDLRNDFIYGLQGGVNKLMPVNAYFVTSAPITQSGMVSGGVAGNEFRKEHSRGDGRVGKEVVVKEEKEDETDVLATEKESRV
jgi:hypothetical protein